MKTTHKQNIGNVSEITQNYNCLVFVSPAKQMRDIGVTISGGGEDGGDGGDDGGGVNTHLSLVVLDRLHPNLA